MKKARNILDKLMDLVEIWIPSAMMLALFIAFLIQIASRYLFNRPLVWPYELSQLAYLWVITLGCNYAQRTDENIVFSVVYDLVPVTVQKIFDLISSLLVSGIFLVVLPKVISFYEFYFTRYSTVFKLPLGLVYLGFLIFMIITIVRGICKIVTTVRSFAQKTEGGNAV